MPFQFQNSEQRRNAEQSVQADAPMNQSTTLRGQQNTAPLYMGESLDAYRNVPTKERYRPDPKARGLEGAFDFIDYQLTGKQPRRGPANLPADYKATEQKAGMEANEFRPGAGFTPMVTPAEEARQSEVQRMAQQYGGFDMGLAIREEAQGKTPEDLVKFYQAQRAAGQDETMKQEMVNYFSQQEGFANSQFGGEKAAQMFVDQNPDIAFREFNKNVPLEVISKGDEQSLRTAGSTEQFGDGEGGMNMSIDMNKAAVMRTFNQDNAYKVHKDATPAQGLKTDFTGMAGQPDVNAEKPRLMASPFAKANKQAFDLLGIESTYGEDTLGEEQFMRLKQRLESIKGNKGFSYDR